MTPFDARYKILALAPFHPVDGESPSVPPQWVEKTTLDEIMASMMIRLPLTVDKSLCPEGRLTFEFDRLKSLHPDGIVKSHAYFQQLFGAKAFIERARRRSDTKDHIRQGLDQWPQLPPIDLKERQPNKEPRAKSGIDNILSMVALDDTGEPKAAEIQDETDRIDVVACSILELLFNDKRFQSLESAWRGLRLLLQQGVLDSAATVHIANVRAETLAQELEALTPHVVGDLPNLILLDLPFGNTPVSVERLNAAAEWAATLMVPLIAWVPPAFFQLSRWSELSSLPFIPHHLETQTYAKFKKLAQSDRGRWLCLTCNRFLIRYPYGEENRARHIPFRESAFNWIAPVWGLGTVIAQSACRDGWPTCFGDIQRYHLQDLALQTTEGPPPMVAEARFDRDRSAQFVQAGFTPLVAETKRDAAFFPKAIVVNGETLPYQLLLNQVTRFVLWCKDHIRSDNDPGRLKTQLEAALGRFNHRTDPPGFSEVAVDVAPIDQDGRIPVAMRWTPSRSTLPSQTPIELRLDW